MDRCETRSNDRPPTTRSLTRILSICGIWTSIGGGGGWSRRMMHLYLFPFPFYARRDPFLQPSLHAGHDCLYSYVISFWTTILQ